MAEPQTPEEVLDPTVLAEEPVREVSAEERSAEEAQARRLADRYRRQFLDMNHFRIDQELFRSIPADLMLRYGFVPYRREGKAIVIVVSDPTDLPMIDELKALLGTPVKVMVGARSAIESILKKSESSQRVLDEATEEFQFQLLKEDENLEDNLTVERLTSDISPIIRLIDSMIYTAIQRRASDIHIETQEDAVHVKYRIDGVLQPAMRPIAKRFHSSIISRIKVMAELDIAEKRVPQDGRFKLRVPGKTIDFRVSIMPSAHGEDSVIRILDKQSISEQFTELRLDILGFPELELRRFRKYIREPYGMVLVTGPTGSGKTTTLYSSLRCLDGAKLNISTVEDPIEYQLTQANQVQVSDKIGMTFSAALRSLLRQDPDVVMLGEIRDAETARIAVQASLTGHLVLSTLHTNDAPASITRLINIGVEPYLISAAVNGILAQRLVRKICSLCKEPWKATDERAKVLAHAGFDGGEAFRGRGCEKCRQTGYSGRLGIYEMLVMDDSMRDLVTRNPDVTMLRKLCRERGLVTLRTDGFGKVLKGLTTVDEILRVTENSM